MTAVTVTHIGELPEVRRYHDDGKHYFILHGGFGIRYIRESIADAALAAAGREVERLRADVLRSDRAVEDAAAALEVCDTTLAEAREDARLYNMARKEALAERDQAMAELAALNARRCETCADRDDHAVDEPCDRFSDSFLALMRDHCKGKPVSCCFWAERTAA